MNKYKLWIKKNNIMSKKTIINRNNYNKKALFNKNNINSNIRSKNNNNIYDPKNTVEFNR